MALWMVRAGKYGEQESFALEKGLAVIGWDEMPDLSGIKTKQELYELLEKVYPDEKPKTLLNWQRQIWSFFKEIQQGDLIALPLKTRSAIAIGEVIDLYQYHSNFPPGSNHTLRVKWIQEFPRSSFDKDLLYSFGAFLTVCRIQRNDAEDRIRALLAGKPQIIPPIPSDSIEWEAPPDLEEYARDQIREYIARKYKGHDLARLTGAVLEA